MVVRFVATGTHKAKLNGPLGIIAPTNKRVHWNGISIFKIKDKKIVEVWGITNNLDLMKQLGGS